MLRCGVFTRFSAVHHGCKALSPFIFKPAVRVVRGINTQQRSLHSSRPLVMSSILDAVNEMSNHRAPRSFIQRSVIPLSGDGLWAARDISKDECISLYGGVFYPPPPQWCNAELQSFDMLNVSDLHLEGSSSIPTSHLIHCTGGGVVDGLNWNSNLYCKAQYAQHPLRGTQPNCKSITFTWEELLQHGGGGGGGSKSVESQETDCSAHLASEGVTRRGEVSQATKDSVSVIGQGPWYVDEGGDVVLLSPACATITIVAFYATRDIIKSEEIYFDYKLGANAPDWYRSVSPSPSG